MQPSHIAIPVELFNAIGSFLDQMPHGKVRALIDGMAEAVRAVKDQGGQTLGAPPARPPAESGPQS